LASILGKLVGMALKKPGHLRRDGLGQKRAGTAAQHLRQWVGKRAWLGKLENITVGHGVSLLQWRSGGANTPTIRRPTLACRHQLLRLAQLCSGGLSMRRSIPKPASGAQPRCDPSTRPSALKAKLPCGAPGASSSPWDRRGVLVVPYSPPGLLEAAGGGSVLDGHLPVRDTDGGHACATLRPGGPWMLAE